MTEADLLSDIDPVLRRSDPNASEATPPLWVYVAGPMRRIAEFNFPAFEAATKQLRALGYKVISPAEQDLGRGFDPSGLTGHEDLSAIGFDLRAALIADLNHIAYECDAICLLPGWEFSKGAAAELALAEALGLPNGSLEDYLEADGWQPLTEHEFLQGLLRPPKPTKISTFPPVVEVDMAKAVVDEIGAHLGLVPQEYVDTILQAEKDRDARLDRLDAFLNGHIRQASLFDRYGVVDTSPCSNCDGRKCMSCVFRDPHDECRDDCPDCCATPARSAWLDTDVLPLKHDETRITSSTGGQKGTKIARFDLIPTGPQWSVAELYGYGTRKYADRNWERGYDWSLSYAAMQRHANLFWSREDDDPETGLPHLAAVVFHALALMEYRTTHPEFDDRPGQ